MALFKNMSITNKGMALFAKAQAGILMEFTKMRVGTGQIGTQNPALLTDLVEAKLDVPISSIMPNPEKKTATIVGNVDNTGLLEPIYICEIGIYARDPDEGEILYGYSNCGEYGDYYAPETQGPYSWQYQIAVAIGNAANVTVELTKLNLDYTVMNTNTSFLVLSGGNQKEINKNIDTKLKSQQDSIVNLNTKVTKNTDDIAEVNTQMAESMQQILEIEKRLANYNSYASFKDDNGIFTVVEYERADATLYMKSTLSNADADGNYQTLTWQLYNDLGTVIKTTIIWSIVYDADGDIISKVVV